MKAHGYEGVITFIKARPVLGILVYMVYAIVSAVTMSIPVVPLWPLIFLVYGLWGAIFATFAADFFGGTIDFLLARNFGKPFVQKIVPQRFLQEVDHIVNGKSAHSFIIFRVFANNYFGIVSYAAGLSKIHLGIYLAITAFTSFAWISIIFFIIKTVLALGSQNALPILLAIYLATGVMGIVVWKIYEKA